VSYGLAVRRGGEYNRLAQPDWEDPLDTSYLKQRGARRNAPGAFGMLYLTLDLEREPDRVAHRRLVFHDQDPHRLASRGSESLRQLVLAGRYGLL
jgi:hypothetical protein